MYSDQDLFAKEISALLAQPEPTRLVTKEEMEARIRDWVEVEMRQAIDEAIAEHVRGLHLPPGYIKNSQVSCKTVCKVACTGCGAIVDEAGCSTVTYGNGPTQYLCPKCVNASITAMGVPDAA